MDAMPFDTSCEEEQLWTAAIEADQQIGREWLRRAELIARAHAVGAAAGRSEFVVCEVKDSRDSSFSSRASSGSSQKSSQGLR